MKTILLIFCFFSLLGASTNLTLPLSSSPLRLNPILGSDIVSRTIDQWIFDSLFIFSADGKKLVPSLAKSYFFKNKTTLIVKLKKDILWQNNDKFTAKDVLFTYKQLINPNNFTPLSDEFKNNISYLKILSPYKILIKYKHPYFRALAMWNVGILPFEVLKNEKNLMTAKFNKHPIGTGPYILKKLQTSKDLVLYANKNYFKKEPNISTITYKFLPNHNTKFLMLKQGKIDLAKLTALQATRQISKKFLKKFNIFESPDFTYTNLTFNLSLKKFKNLKIRQAINLAINKKQLIKIVFLGHAQICLSPFVIKNPKYLAKLKLMQKSQNLKKSRKILKSLGFDKAHPFRFTIITQSLNKNLALSAQVLQYQLSLVNILVKIRILPWEAFINNIINTKHFECILLDWGKPLLPNPSVIFSANADKLGGYNLARYHNKKIDKLIKQENITNSLEKIDLINYKITRILQNNLPYIYLYTPNIILAISKKIQNIKPSFTGIFYNERMWKIKQN